MEQPGQPLTPQTHQDIKPILLELKQQPLLLEVLLEQVVHPGGGPYSVTTAFESYNGTTWTNLTGAPTAKAGDPPMTGTTNCVSSSGLVSLDTSGTPSNQTSRI